MEIDMPALHAFAILPSRLEIHVYRVSNEEPFWYEITCQFREVSLLLEDILKLLLLYLSTCCLSPRLLERASRLPQSANRLSLSNRQRSGGRVRCNKS